MHKEVGKMYLRKSKQRNNENDKEIGPIKNRATVNRQMNRKARKSEEKYGLRKRVNSSKQDVEMWEDDRENQQRR